MVKYRLGDIASVKQGAVPDNEQCWLLNLDAVESNTGNVLDYVYVDYSQIGASTVSFDQKNVLYSKLRPYLNKVVLPDRAGYATSEMLPLMPDEKIITREYLAFFLRSPHFVEYINGKTNGAKMPRANIADLKAVEIECPPIVEQNRIVSQLNSILTIIAYRKKELLQLDDLIKARFVEMFGHQCRNEKGLPYQTIDDVAEIYLGITHTPKYVDNGVIFISAKNTSRDYLDLSDVKYISKEEYKNAPVGSKPKKNDVLFSRVGSNLGHPVILEKDIELCSFVSLGFLRSKGRVTSNYIKHWMRDDYFSIQVTEHVKGGGQPNLNTGWLKKFKIIVPELKDQNEFDFFCRQVNKTKIAVQTALDETQELFSSLLQEYFG